MPDAINSISAPWLTETTLVRVRIQGFGTLLMEEAERIARDEHGSEKISVISGVGVRSYYKKLGYWLDGPYMSKWLDGRPGPEE